VYNSFATASGREHPLPSFGKKLKLEREKQAITLEQISSSTKIGTRMLQALEDENFDQLPGGIFNKGFVRAYARHVGLDEDQAIADYLEASGQNTPVQQDAKADAETVRPELGQLSSSTPIPWGSLAAALLVITLAIWLWNRWHHKSDEPSAPPPLEVTQKTSSSPTRSAPSSPPAKESNPVASPVSSVGADPITAPPPKATATAPLATLASAPITVVIIAREDSWLSISADGKTVFEDTLIAENQHAVHAQNQVFIKAGNTGGLDFVFNGSKLHSQGEYGEVKTLTFGITGLQEQASKSLAAR
jgi:cytoskeleton protein RodZ